MNFNMPEDMGPLPEFQRQAVLQRLSINALNSFLPADQFLFRGQAGEDAGVDGELEIRYAGNSSNCRSKVQLKATDSEKSNTDGSVSLSVTTKNLNYLLNGPSPLYILYIEPRKELRFAWALDEVGRIEKETPTWKGQGSITIRFREVLTEAALAQIHTRIVREAKFHRDLAEILGRSSDCEQVSVHIDPESLTITDPTSIRDLLLGSGMSLVGAGHAKQVSELGSHLAPADARLPRIRLVLAYAEFAQSKLYAAQGHIQEALLQRSQLSEEDRDFLIFLRDGCDHESGRIDLAEYIKRKEKWSENAKSQFGIVHRLECLGHELTSNLQSDAVPSIIEQIRAAVGEILSDTRSSEMLKLQARLKLQYAEGVQLIRLFGEESAISEMRAGLSRVPNPYATRERLMERYMEWEAGLDDLFNQAIKTNHFRLIGDMALSEAIVRFLYLTNTYTEELTNRTIELPADLVEKALKGVRLSIVCFQQSGYVLGELKAKMLLVDYLELCGKRDESRALAAEILPDAEAMGFAGVEEHIKEQVAGKSLLSYIDEKLKDYKSLDRDVVLANEPDEKMRKFASTQMIALELPAERFPVVLRHALALRAEARERVSWCRYFSLEEDERHRASQETQFLTDPERFGACIKHRLIAGIGFCNADEAITAFQQAICATCPDRSPKSPEP